MSSYDSNAIMTDNEAFLEWVTHVFIDDLGANQLPPFHSNESTLQSQLHPQWQEQSQPHSQPQFECQVQLQPQPQPQWQHLQFQFQSLQIEFQPESQPQPHFHQFQPQSQPQSQPQPQPQPEPVWTEDENKAFKTLVVDSFAEVIENRWEAVATHFPRKSPEQLMERLDKLLKDVSVIRNRYMTPPLHANDTTSLQQNNNLVSSNNPIINGTTPPNFTDHQHHSVDQFLQANNSWEATMNGNQNYYNPIPPLSSVNNAAFQNNNNLVSTPIMNNGATPPYCFTDHQHQSLGELQANPWEDAINMDENHYTIPLLDMNNDISMPIMNGATPPYLTHHQHNQCLDRFQTNSWEAAIRNLSQNNYIAPPNVNNTAGQNNLVSMPIMNNGIIPPYLTYHQYQRMEEEVVAAPVENNVVAMEQNQPENQAMGADDNNNNRRKIDHWTKEEHANGVQSGLELEIKLKEVTQARRTC
ncbi:hypothetical protein PIB30_027096 [Stylosanthes scabra]|uniref:Myb-like domain-containing protein n=1 Tax=Stylosanthes scabra TaxID=79078 RepID=A0ABU6VBZ7_9FABA|nr:hypothetical protein [Stylosanthes scabra]